MIVDNRIYDINTSEELGHSCRDYNTHTFIRESLFRARNGCYFISGEGGPKSSYAKFAVRGSTNQKFSGITVLTESEATIWAERYLDFGEYLKMFNMSEDEYYRNNDVITADGRSYIQRKIRGLDSEINI